MEKIEYEHVTAYTKLTPEQFENALALLKLAGVGHGYGMGNPVYGNYIEVIHPGRVPQGMIDELEKLFA